MLLEDMTVSSGAAAILRPYGLGEAWPTGGTVLSAVEENGAYRLQALHGETRLDVWVEAGGEGPAFVKTRRFRIRYGGSSLGLPRAALRFLRELARVVETNEAWVAAPAGAPRPVRIPFRKEVLLANVERALAAGPLDEVEIILSNPCEMACVFCPQGDLALVGRASPFAHDEELDHLAFQIRLNERIGARRLRVNGNDPLMHRHLFRLVELARASGFREVAVQTPGLRLDDRDLAQRLAAAGVTRVDMPFYGHTEALFSAVTGVPGSKARAERAVRNLLDTLIEPRLHGVATEATLAHVADTARYVRETFGLPYTICHYVPHHIDRSKHRQMPSYRRVREAIAASPESFGPGAGFPLCVYPEALRARAAEPQPAGRSANFYEHALPFGELRSPDWQPTLARTFPPLCERCTLRPRCPGTYQAYSDLHADEGLAPVA